MYMYNKDVFCSEKPLFCSSNFGAASFRMSHEGWCRTSTLFSTKPFLEAKVIFFGLICSALDLGWWPTDAWWKASGRAIRRCILDWPVNMYDDGKGSTHENYLQHRSIANLSGPSIQILGVDPVLFSFPSEVWMYMIDTRVGTWRRRWQGETRKTVSW